MRTVAELMTIRQASDWARQYLRRNVTPANISYLIQYGRIRKVGDNGNTLICKEELIRYYHSYLDKKETSWTRVLGEDCNWHLSFDYLKEAERTKHVHRLHPYKGKFIPQLVEYFLDSHTDEFKQGVYFRKGDIILDPFDIVPAAEKPIKGRGRLDKAWITGIAETQIYKERNKPHRTFLMDFVTGGLVVGLLIMILTIAYVAGNKGGG